MFMSIDPYEISRKSSDFVLSARNDAGLSQQDVYPRMRLSRATYQKIESGERLMDPVEAAIFCEITNKAPQSYTNYLYTPKGFEFKGKNAEQIEKAVIDCVKSMPTHTQKLFVDILTRDWGGNPLQLMELAAAHTYTPLIHRLTVSHSIVQAYQLEAAACEREGSPLQPLETEPVYIDDLDRTNQVAREAYVSGSEGYVVNT